MELGEVKVLVERGEHPERAREVAEKLLNVKVGNVRYDWDIFVDRLLKNGRVWNCPVEAHRADEIVGYCHVVATMTFDRSGKILKVCTGYGYYDGTWYRHSWNYDKLRDVIVDIGAHAEVYWGYLLGDGEVKRFGDWMLTEPCGDEKQ